MYTRYWNVHVGGKYVFLLYVIIQTRKRAVLIITTKSTFYAMFVCINFVVADLLQVLK